MTSKEWEKYIRSLAKMSHPDDMELCLLADFAVCEKERDEAKSLNVYFRDAVGECHLMISRNTSAYQVWDQWGPSDLPPRLQKVMARAEAAEARCKRLEEKLRIAIDEEHPEAISFWRRSPMADQLDAYST